MKWVDFLPLTFVTVDLDENLNIPLQMSLRLPYNCQDQSRFGGFVIILQLSKFTYYICKVLVLFS